MIGRDLAGLTVTLPVSARLGYAGQLLAYNRLVVARGIHDPLRTPGVIESLGDALARLIPLPTLENLTLGPLWPDL
jgi:hypothetical protein